jgi:D-3-phosphoglycerate dehydrogenase
MSSPKSLNRIPVARMDAKMTSYPKSKIKILLMENVHQVAVDELRKDGFTVKCAESMPMAELIEEMKTTHVVGIRSKTPMDAELLKHAAKLMCVGCFCIGTDRVDLPWAAAHGIPVFNAPFSNTRSVAEVRCLLPRCPHRPLPHSAPDSLP